MSGLQLNFSESDLAASAAAYDPAVHEAPLVVGHPQADLPAYGWVKSLNAEDGLFAEPHQVNPEFSEMVRSGAFKKISVKFYAPTDASNPVPGVYYLRHVGFLGAQPPAVKGLKGIEFADDAQGVEVELEFSEAPEQLLWATEGLVSLMRTLRDHLIEKEGAEAADKVLPAWRLDSAAESLARARAERDAQREAPRFSEEQPPEPSSLPSASEAAHSGTDGSPEGSITSPPETTTVNPEEVAALKAQNEALAAQLAAAETTLQAQAAAANTAAHTAFAEALIAEARVAPTDKALIVAALDHLEPPVLAGSQAQAVEFGEGEAKVPMATALKDWLKALPKRVEFGEQAGRERAAEGQGAAVDGGVTYAEGTPADTIALDQRIRKYAADNKLSYADAASAVARG